MVRAELYTLSNGVEWITDRDWQEKEFAVFVTSRMGSAKERIGRNEGGALHIAEHLTTVKSTLEDTIAFARKLKQLGIEDNGATSASSCHYYLQGRSRHRNYILAEAFESLRAWPGVEEFVRERNVLCNELADELTKPKVLLSMQSERMLFPQSNYGITLEDDFQNLPKLTPAIVQRVRDRLFRSSNLTIITSSSRDPEEFTRIMESTFGQLPKSPALESYQHTQHERESYYETTHVGERCLGMHVLPVGHIDTLDKLATFEFVHGNLHASLDEYLRLKGPNLYHFAVYGSVQQPEASLVIAYTCAPEDFRAASAAVSTMLEETSRWGRTFDYHRDIAVKGFQNDVDNQIDRCEWYVTQRSLDLFASPKQMEAMLRNISPAMTRRMIEPAAEQMLTLVSRPQTKPVLHQSVA